MDIDFIDNKKKIETPYKTIFMRRVFYDQYLISFLVDQCKTNQRN